MNFAFAMDLVGCEFSHIPLPLATLAALTPPEHDVEIVDENVERVDLDMAADVVALTGIYCQRERLFELADAFRARGRHVVIGGPLASDVFDECCAHADTVFVGEAEYTFKQFFADLARGEPNDVYRQDTFIDMHESPVPRFDLLKAARYSSACVQATRGCPYRCEYCDVPSKQGGRPRSKTIAQVLEEVRQLADLGFDSIFFVDDHFMGNRRYARELLIALAEVVPTLPTAMYFYTQLTLNVARDEEMLALFHAASFRRFFVGIETSDVAKLRAITKPQNTEMDVRTAVARIQAYNITVWAGIMLGLDDDTVESFEDQLRFITESGITPTLVGIMQAMPGAPLYERVQREGRLRTLPTVVGSGAFGGFSTQGITNVTPKQMEIPALLAGFSDLVRRMYEADAYGTRILASTARGMRSHPAIGPALNRRNFAIIARTARYYLRDADPASRRLFLRVMGAIAARGLQGFEELFFHLVIYKHLREFYFGAADMARSAA